MELDPEMTDRRADVTAERLRGLLEVVDVGYCVAEMLLDAGGEPVDARFVETNAAFRALTKLRYPDGHTIVELAPDVGGGWLEKFARTIADGTPVRYEQHAPAIGKWFDVFATPLDEPGMFALVVTDQTPRRLGEEALRLSENRFRTMVDDMPLIVWEHGPDGQQTWVNNTFCSFFGTTREAMRADRWHVFTHPDDLDTYAEAFVRAISERTSFQGRVRVRDAHGGWRWFDSWGQPRFDDQGVYLGMVGASADVTDLVESRARIRESEAFTRRVLDSLFSYVAVLDADGRVVEVNRLPLGMAGMRVDDVVGRPFWECRWWDRSEVVERRLRDAIARAFDGETVRQDIGATGRGQPIWIDFQIAPLRSDGGTITHLVASGHDVTSRYAAEEQLGAALDAERIARRRVELLERTATHLAAATTLEEIAAAVLFDLEHSLGLRVVAVDVLDGEVVRTAGSAGIPASPEMSELTIHDELPGPAAIATNSTIVVNSADELGARFPRLEPFARRHPVESVAAVPLRSGAGTALGALVIGIREPGAIDDTLRSLLQGIAGQLGQAIDRAQLHERVVETSRQEHAIALQFQRALLPTRLVEHPAVEIAASYAAAEDLLAVGGDWYDTHLWDDRYLGLTVGDVVGHDAHAATTMGNIRIATAALMPTIGPDPAAVLRLHGDLVNRHDTFATAASVVVDLHHGSVRYALAGHPPPLLVADDGTVRWLDGDTAPPLGFADTADDPVVGEATLTPGCRLVLYSDGLVERRGEAIDDGLQRLAATASGLAAGGPTAASFATDLVTELTQDGIDDDVIVVCVTWRPPV